MAKLPKRIGASQRYTSSEFKPYVTALGQLALAWNDLQESLAALFWTLMTPIPITSETVNYYMPLRIWATIKSDRTQRDLLKTVIRYSKTDWRHETWREDLDWLVERVRSLEDSRNDAIHSPLFSVEKSLYGFASSGKVAPAQWLFNPRAIKLSERSDLLAEFHFCRDSAIILSEYAQMIDRALVHPKRAWPNKPSLPSRKPKTTPPNPRPQPPPKRRPPPPRSSRA
jgi:hypothetical protein